MQLFEALNAHVRQVHALHGGSKALVILDCAPTHVAKSFREAIAERYPDILLHYVPASLTSAVQPLDLSFFAPFKNRLKQQCKDYLHCHLDTADDQELAGRQREAFIRSKLQRAAIQTQLIQNWIPRVLSALSLGAVTNGFVKAASTAFPHLGFGFFDEGEKIINVRSPKHEAIGRALNRGEDWPQFFDKAAVRRIGCDDYSLHTKPQLKDMCRQRALPVTGSKQLLIQRLVEQDAQLPDEAEDADMAGDSSTDAHVADDDIVADIKHADERE